MQIIIDSNENAPWSFSPKTSVIRRSLNTGDYSLPGYENIICVERKSLNDLVKSVVGDWQRFGRVCRRMASFDCAVIVVESSPTALLEHQYTGDTNPLSVRGKINKILLDFGIATVFLDNRTIAAEWVENLFELWLERRK